MSLLFPLLTILPLIAFVRDPVAWQWWLLFSLALLCFASGILIRRRRLLATIPLLLATSALFFTLLLVETMAARAVLIAIVGVMTWVWWQHMGRVEPSRHTTQYFLALFALLFVYGAALSAHAAAIYLAWSIVSLGILIFFGTVLFSASVLILTGWSPWFAPSVAIALFSAELFVALAFSTIAFFLRALVQTVVLAGIVALACRNQQGTLTPTVVRTVIVCVLVASVALMATAMWI